VLSLLLCVLGTLACASPETLAANGARSGDVPLDGPANERCPERKKAPSLLPGTRPEHAELEYWLARSSPALDEVLLDEAELRSHDEALRLDAEGAPRTTDLGHALAPDEILEQLTARLDYLRTRLESGEYRTEASDALASVSRSTLINLDPQPSLRRAAQEVRLHCAPFAEPIIARDKDARFDRNRCSSVRAEAPVELLARLPNGFAYARSRDAVGFVAPTAALSTALSPNEAEEVRKARPKTRPLTRRALLTEAFKYMGSPYGWGDEGGGRDCSRLTLDVLESFGLHLPRVSVEQSRSGTYTLDIPEQAGEVERLSLLDEAHARGVVLIHFPGHIMIYLGRDREGVPRVLHSFAEYLAPCDDGAGETLFEVDRVSVTGLDLGQGTSRRSFLERMTQLTVFGKSPGYALLSFAHFRRAAPPVKLDPKSCEDSLDIRLFKSPRTPRADAPLRVIAASTEDTRPSRLWLVDPEGKLLAPEPQELGVGPFARVVELEKPTAGRWTVLLADGPRVLACERFRVAPAGKSEVRAPRAPDAAAWSTRARWERDVEHLYAAFVEQLFSHPVEDTRTWTSLDELIRDRERNLLYDHLGLGEDEALRLEPDCADLPYSLRAYFAWKLGLPFGFRHCTRGKPGVPPRCNALETNAQPFEAPNDVQAFRDFARRVVGSAVHSASGRTRPDDEATDFYPIALTRRALSPGTMFADPYGHMIVVAKWVPQGLLGSGMLLGADAQPDAAVGRRRFWPGNFLFTPDTTDAGAGFKAFRPIVLDAETRALRALGNGELTSHPDFAPYAREQYELSADDFYTRMDELIYPRPLAVGDRLRMVVDALEEQTVRRISAVDNGEAFVRGNARGMDMPDGHAIFETQGPWEDFATPSRDMRLLIAIDTVRAFPERVRAQPERYGIAHRELSKRIEALDTELRDALRGRRFRYTRSDGSPFELTLNDVVERVKALEMAYNPNDCVELRWGAPENSDEAKTCKRRAPAAQREKMARYRQWFRTRTRPPR
jgi:cell wall-associated NlpC family hydrolase